MTKTVATIRIFGSLQIATIFVTLATIFNSARYPLLLLYLPILLFILGVNTIKLRPWARRLNLIFSPLISIVYACSFMIIVDGALAILNYKYQLNQIHFYSAWAIFFSGHLYFFIKSDVKKLFSNTKVIIKDGSGLLPKKWTH